MEIQASHVFTSRDLAKSREFYTEVVGLLVSDEDRNTLYLRGLEERAHHSLVIKHSDEPSACHRVGMRVFEDEELDRAKHHFERLGLPCQWVDVPFQGRTLQTVDAVGTPLEIVATMTQRPRRDMDVQVHRGGAARRFDHYQITVPEVAKAAEFYTSIGFRIADYITAGEHAVGAFLHVKDTPYDIVFVERDGPAFHHCAYIIMHIQAMLRACDTAGVLGWPDCVEYGPGKHALGHSYYVYLLDPDGHRVELLLPPIVYMGRCACDFGCDANYACDGMLGIASPKLLVFQPIAISRMGDRKHSRHQPTAISREIPSLDCMTSRRVGSA